MVSDKGKRVQTGEVSSSSAVHDVNGYEIQKQRSLNGYIFTACLAFAYFFVLIAFARTSFSFEVPFYIISDSIIVEMLPFELPSPDSINVEKPPFELQNGKYLIIFLQNYFRRTTGPARRSTKGQWTPEEVRF